MGGEYVARRGHLARLVVGEAKLLHDHPGSFRPQKRRMSFVHVAHGWPYTERMKRPHATDPQYDLLLDAQLAFAPVQRSGHLPVVGRVRGNVGIEQIDRKSVV